MVAKTVQLVVLRGRDTHIDFLRFVSGSHVCLMMMTMQPSLTTTKTGTACEQALHLMHQSNPTAPILLPPGISFFFVLDGKFPGPGTLELPNAPRWGRKERVNAPSSSLIHNAVFIDRQSNSAILSISNVSANVCLCNSVILIKL